MTLLKRHINRPISPDGRLYATVRALSRALHKAGLLTPNSVHDYIYSGDAVLILTPLSGSSSIKLNNRDRVATRFEPRPRVFILWRENAQRMQSAYNKKIRNPASLFKAMQLVTLGGLDPRSSVDDFLDYLERTAGDYGKDKHLFLNEEILSCHHLDEDEVVKVDITRDGTILQDTFGLRLAPWKNSSAEKATYQDIVTFSREQCQRITRMERRMKEMRP